MARIALRVYNNEINDLIDHGQTEEAVAHCRHILQTYSKHINTYRLLGKAYLENQRYGDAADILQRVLSAIPEDFISQVGMSIIREDEGNLETAIFHMERAFEVQPSNHAIQDELRRLYGRRDGLEPQRIRLTRGALARMYAHGHLHDQAIAELLAALSEDPQRYDLMVLLANMYFQAEKYVEAAETCTKILEKLPYCLDANRLLVTILESSNRGDNARTYRERLEQLDPYTASLDTDHTNIEFVSDQSVTVERLEWEPGDYDYRTDPGREAWASSLGSDFLGESSAEGLTSDWLNRRGDEQLDPSESLFGETPSRDEEKRAPDWLPTPDKELGDFDLGITPEPPSPDDQSPTSFNEETPGKPEWITTPTDAEESLEESLFPSQDEPKTTPDSVGPSDEDVSEPIGETSIDAEGIPDFMREAGWAPSTSEEEATPQTFSESLPSEQVEEPPLGETPEWMQDIAPSEDEIVEPTPSSLTEDSIIGDIQAEPATDWQQPLESGEVESQVDATGTSEADELTSPLDPLVAGTIEEESPPDDEEGMAWLESLAAKQGIGEEELVTSPEERDEASPDWLKASDTITQPDTEEEPSMEWLDQLSQEAAKEAAPDIEVPDRKLDRYQSEDLTEPQPQPETPIQVEPIPSETPTTTYDEEGMAWLESLAAKQGIPEEELVTTPEERRDSPPDWLEPIQTETGPEEVELSMEWLDQLSQNGTQEVTPSFEKEEELQDKLQPEEALSQSPQKIPIPEEPTLSEPIPSEAPPTRDDEEGLAWLESLSDKQDGAEEELTTSQEESDETSPDWLQPTEETSQADIKKETSIEWLEKLSQGGPQEIKEAPRTEEPIHTAERESNEWLASLGLSETESSEPPVSPTEDEKTDWLDTIAPIQKTETAEEETIPDFEDLIEKPLDWLSQVKEDYQLNVSQERISTDDASSGEWLEQLSQETDIERETGVEIEPTEEWLAELNDLEEEITTEEEMGATPEAIEKVDEWIESLEQPGEEGEETLEPDSEEPLFPSDILEEEAPTISFLEEGLETESDSTTIPPAIPEEQTDSISESEIGPSVIPEDELDAMLESEKGPLVIPEDKLDAMLEGEGAPSIVPEWLQDVAEQRPEPDAIYEPPEWLPSIDEPVEGVGDIAPTLPEEWQPESKIETPKEETTPKPVPKPKPKPKPPLDISEELGKALQAIRDADIEEAANIYTKLIKKGKGIEEIIGNIEEALRKHPVDVSLWQVLGDAFMRADRLQEALDAYSKAEDLLR